MDRKVGVIILGALALVLVCGTLVLAAGLWAGFGWFRTNAHMGYGDPGMMWNAPGWDDKDIPCADEGVGRPGMMGGDWGAMPCGQGYPAPGGTGSLSLEDAQAAVERYIQGYEGLHVTEVMEFERNFYAIVAEEDTGIGAIELLIDKGSGAVGPEPGPNMMWNARYGMHGGRMGMGRMWGGQASGEMVLSPREAEQAAQRWLDANLPGRSAGEADAFYGYYTLHFLRDGQIDGMLSVHGSSGDVWFHSWHGGFIAMTGEHE